MEYDEEPMHGVPIFSQNVVVSVTSKVKDSALYTTTAPVIALLTIIAPNPVSKLPKTLVKVPNALVVKLVSMPSKKL